MKSDIQIAQEAKMEYITKISEKLNLTEDDILNAQINLESKKRKK